MLGFGFLESASEDSDSPPLGELAQHLVDGPAILGPVDMGLLPYHPKPHKKSGVDHFVIGYAMDESRIFLNDPWGYPHVSVDYDQLVKSWRAELIPYRRGWYRYWTKPVRRQKPTASDLRRRAVQAYCDSYRSSELSSRSIGFKCGSEAITEFTDRIHDYPSDGAELGCLNFMLPVSSKRSLDFAEFFAGFKEELSQLKRNESAMLGQAHVANVLRDLRGLADSLNVIAELEARARKLILSS